MSPGLLSGSEGGNRDTGGYRNFIWAGNAFLVVAFFAFFPLPFIKLTFENIIITL